MVENVNCSKAPGRGDVSSAAWAAWLANWSAVFADCTS